MIEFGLGMKKLKFIVLILFLLAIASCSSSRRVSYKSSEYKKTEKRDRNRKSKRIRVAKTSTAHTKVAKSSSASKSVNSVIKEAHKYLGTPYKYGGSTRSGLDCSGLVINAFDAANYKMPRISRDQANVGKEIRLRDVKEGDLVFFKTSGSSINHVGIVDKVIKGEVYFIHSSTSKGVIVSSLEETYWNKRFVKATRVL